MSQDYKKAKIYKITNDYNDEIYIGSTCDTLGRRFSVHKCDSRRERNKNRPLYKLMNDIGSERFRIQLICNYPCDDKYQLRQKEGEYIRNTGHLNKNIAGRTDKEYEQETKEHKREYKKEYIKKNKDKIKEYNEENKEHIKEYMKEYRDKNKEKLKEQTTQYRNDNKEKIRAMKKEYYEKTKLINNNNIIKVSS